MDKYNIYASHFQHYSGDNNKSINKQKKLLNKLSNSLLDNQWIRISNIDTNINININLNIDKILTDKKYYISLKPYGIWLSKGEWLFHIICCYPDSYISLVEVDYSKIYRISNKIPNNYKIDKYYINKLEKFHKSYMTTNGIDIDKRLIQVINWKHIYQNYNGFAIYPLQIKTNKYILEYLLTYDVSSLVIWNSDSIIKQYTLCKISDYINIKSDTNIIIDNTILINKLIKKIDNINK